MSEFVHPHAASGALRRIDIIRTDETFLVVPARGGALSFDSFTLSKIRGNLMAWLLALGDTCWREHHRCMGCALILDTTSRLWAPIIPRQTLGHDAPALQVMPADFEGLPESTVLAGSIQMLGATDPRHFSDAIPTYSGVHFLHVMEGKTQGIWAFIRTSAGCHQVQVETVADDDRENVLANCQSRLVLA